jgi:hypothetical protein
VRLGLIVDRIPLTRSGDCVVLAGVPEQPRECGPELLAALGEMNDMEKENVGKTRLQFDFSGEALAELDDLKRATGASNRAEVIRQALRVLQWTIEQTHDENATVLVEKDGRQREVVFPFLASGRTAATVK